MKLVKIVGLGIAAAAMAAWLGAAPAAAKAEYAKATGKKCADCHVGAPKDKKLTDAGKKFKTCFDKNKDAAKCK